MKKITFLALMAAALPLAALHAQEFRTDMNPALLYYQAFLLAPKESFEHEQYMNMIMSAWPVRPPAEAVKKFQEGSRGEFLLLRRAAQSKALCDWGIDLGDGPRTFLPQLGPSKAAAQALCLSAIWHLQDGDQTSARDNLLAAFVLGRNTARDGTLISGLMQFAIELVVCKRIAVNYFQFSNETLRQLEAGFDAAPPLESLASRVSTERSMFVDGWLPTQLEAIRTAHPGYKPRSWKNLAALLQEITDNGDKTSRFHIDELAKASGTTVEGAQKLAKGMAPYYDRLAVVLALPYREFPEPMKQLSEDIKHSDNPFVEEFLPAFFSARGREFNIEVKLAMVRAAIEYRLRGEEGLKGVADPCGSGPFEFEPYSLDGVRRGFKLTSAVKDWKSMIFVEKEGRAFQIDGGEIGKPIETSAAKN